MKRKGPYLSLMDGAIKVLCGHIGFAFAALRAKNDLTVIFLCNLHQRKTGDFLLQI